MRGTVLSRTKLRARWENTLFQLCRCSTEFHSVTEIETDDRRRVGVTVEMDDHRLRALPPFHVEVHVPRGKSADARIRLPDQGT